MYVGCLECGTGQALFARALCKVAQHAGPQFVVGHLRLYLRILEGVPRQDEEAATFETETRRSAQQHCPYMYSVSHQVCADFILLKIRGVKLLSAAVCTLL